MHSCSIGSVIYFYIHSVNAASGRQHKCRCYLSFDPPEKRQGFSHAVWGIGLRVFSVLNHLVVSVRPGKDRNRCSFLVPLDAPAHKVPNDTPAAKLADTTVRCESFQGSNSSLGVSVLIRWGVKGNTKPAKCISVFHRANRHKRLSNLEKTCIITGCPKGMR